MPFYFIDPVNINIRRDISNEKELFYGPFGFWIEPDSECKKITIQPYGYNKNNKQKNYLYLEIDKPNNQNWNSHHIPPFFGDIEIIAEMKNGNKKKIRCIPDKEIFIENNSANLRRDIESAIKFENFLNNAINEKNFWEWDKCKLWDPTSNLIASLDTETLINEIYDSLGALFSVIEKPRFELRNIEEMQPVDRVRRTGRDAAKKLASDPKNWQSQFLDEIKPLKILSISTEEEIQTYPNRMVKTLIDLLYAHITRISSKVYDSIDFVNDIQEYYQEQDYDKDRYELIKNTFNDYNVENFDTQMKAIGDRERKLKVIKDAITAAMKSKFYRNLKNCIPVKHPLKEGNVLRMDKNYRTLLDLWHKLHGEKVMNLGYGETMDKPFNSSYFTFSQALIINTIKKLNFEILEYKQEFNGNCYHFIIKFKAQRISSDGNSRWIIEYSSSRNNNKDYIELKIQHNTKEFQIPDNLLNLLRENNVRNMNMNLLEYAKEGLAELNNECRIENNKLIFTNFEFYQNNELIENVKDILKPINFNRNNNIFGPDANNKMHCDLYSSWKRFIKGIIKSCITSKKIIIRFIPLPYNFTSIKEEKLPEVCEKIKSDIESLQKNQENNDSIYVFALLPQDIRHITKDVSNQIARFFLNYGDNLHPDFNLHINRGGVLPISRIQFESQIRIKRIINRLIISEDIKEKRQKTCPVCGANNFRIGDNKFYICNQCETRWGNTQCQNQNCKQSYPIIIPKKGNPQIDETEDFYPRAIIKLETKVHSNSISSPCEGYGNINNNRSICPHCHHCGNCRENECECSRCNLNQGEGNGE